MGNHKFTIRYDGRSFYGWQRLADKPTVQGTLEDALAAVCGHPVAIFGAGRTDRGAHAEGQVFHAAVDHDGSLVEDINRELPASVRVLTAEPVPADFHARKASTGKLYRYEIWNDSELPAERDGRVWHVTSALDVDAMKSACPVLVGTHDFASFATKPNFKQKSTVRELRRLAIASDAPQVTLVMEADGFLYKMVRNIVRTLVKVGEGRYQATDVQRILAARDRQSAPGTAPASGLYLDSVLYG